MGITLQFTAFGPLLRRGIRVRYEVIRKSDITDQLTDADILRDTTSGGLAGTIRSACNHFDAATRAAAQRLSLVLDHYGNLAVLPYDDETASLMKFTNELMGTYKARHH